MCFLAAGDVFLGKTFRFSSGACRARDRCHFTARHFVAATGLICTDQPTRPPVKFSFLYGQFWWKTSKKCCRWPRKQKWWLQLVPVAVTVAAQTCGDPKNLQDFCRKKSFDLRFFCQFSKTPSCVILGERVFAFEVMAWYCWCFWERIGKHLWQYTMKPQNMAVGMVQLTYCYTNCRVKEFNKDNYWALMPTTLDQMKQPDFLHNIQALYLDMVHCDCSSSSSAGMFGMFRGGCWPPISTSPISARYRCMNACMLWPSLHRQAAIRATSNAANMITGSSNESGRRVLYNFFNVQWYSDRMHQNKVNKPSWGRHAYAPGQKEDTEDMYSCIDMFFFLWPWRLMLEEDLMKCFLTCWRPCTRQSLAATQGHTISSWQACLYSDFRGHPKGGLTKRIYFTWFWLVNS